MNVHICKERQTKIKNKNALRLTIELLLEENQEKMWEINLIFILRKSQNNKYPLKLAANNNVIFFF